MKVLIDLNLSPRSVKQSDKPSVVQIRSEDLNPQVIGKPAINALRQMTAELDEGALLTIDSRRTRVRLLPLRLR